MTDRARTQGTGQWMWRTLVTVALLLGAVMVELAGRDPAHADPAEQPVLPDLVSDPPVNPAIYVDDSAGNGPELLLRFDGYIHNAGEGELHVVGERATLDDPLAVRQLLYPADRYAEGDQVQELPLPDAVMEFNWGDGHEHFHLDRISRYSLWDGTRAFEVAPSMKVGFCLMDSERVDPHSRPIKRWRSGLGPCGQEEPELLVVGEGISPGYRDHYPAGIAFQWIDISSVQPGAYWIRSDIDPEDVVVESNELNEPGWSAEQTIVPGYTALAGSAQTEEDSPVDVTLTAQSWSGGTPDSQPVSDRPSFAIVDPPEHGTLGEIAADGTVRYTPDPDYHGPDSFGFVARDGGSPFPTSPAAATVTVNVEEIQSSVTIDNAPDKLMAGTSVQLSTTVIDDDPAVSWEASAGTISSGGLFTAPGERPAGGTVTVTARTANAADSRAIEIEPRPVVPRPKVTIDGAPGSMVAGESVQLTATVVDDAQAVSWTATAGTITAGGLFTAPDAPPAGGTVRVVATSARGATDSRTIEIRAKPAPPQPVVAISGAPERLVVGTTVQLSATVVDDLPSVSWSASAGTITPDGAFTAPAELPAGGSVQVTARSSRASDTRTIAIEARAPVIPRPLPDPPPDDGHDRPKAKGPLSAIAAARIGRQLAMSVTPSKSGRLRVTAYVGRRKLGECVARVRSRRLFTCRIKLGRNVSARARIRIVAGLRVGKKVSRVERRAAPIGKGHAH